MHSRPGRSARSLYSVHAPLQPVEEIQQESQVKIDLHLTLVSPPGGEGRDAPTVRGQVVPLIRAPREDRSAGPLARLARFEAASVDRVRDHHDVTVGGCVEDLPGSARPRGVSAGTGGNLRLSTGLGAFGKRPYENVQSASLTGRVGQPAP